jgi:hypothetical protein
MFPTTYKGVVGGGSPWRVFARHLLRKKSAKEENEQGKKYKAIFHYEHR